MHSLSLHVLVQSEVWSVRVTRSTTLCNISLCGEQMQMSKTQQSTCMIDRQQAVCAVDSNMPVRQCSSGSVIFDYIVAMLALAL